MFLWIKKLFGKERCFLCSKKIGKEDKVTKYLDVKDKAILVCDVCVEYAERRAFRKSV